MIGIDQERMVAHRVLRLVGKFKGGFVRSQNTEDCAMGEAAQSEDHLEIFHGIDLSLKECGAGPDFGADGFVFRRYAANRVGYPAIQQAQPIIDA
mgnify:CR=1 FL=1